MWNPTGLLLGPGGVKGFMELGFLLYMEKKGLLINFDSFSGVSIGSIIALLIVCGYSIVEIINEASKTDLLEDISQLKIIDIQENAGIISQNKIRETLERLVIAKFGKVLTLEELYNATGVDLHMTSLELDKISPKPLHFSRYTEPNASCVEATLLSANIPLIFRRLYYKGRCFVDGALGDPYPIHILDNGQRDVLGLYLAADYGKEDTLMSYIRQIFYVQMIQMRNKNIQQSSERCRHVPLYSTSMDPIGITMDQGNKLKMVTEGFEIAKRFFENNVVDQVTISAKQIDSIEGDS